MRADLEGLVRQRANLHLVAPVDGLVTTRDADPGTTVVAGQPVMELSDPSSMWINVRFDQLQSAGLRADLPVRIVLRPIAPDRRNGRDHGFAAPIAGLARGPQPQHPTCRWIDWCLADRNRRAAICANTIAPYMLTQRLLSLLGKSGRVINLSSAAQSPVDPEALTGQGRLSDAAAYAQSKPALTMI